MSNLPDRISYSSWQVYRNFCQWRWKLDNVDFHRKEVHGLFLDFGKSMHSAIEKRKAKKDPVDIQTAQKFFEDDFKEKFLQNKDKYREKDRNVNIEEFISAAKVIIEHLDRCKELTESQVIFNEHPLLMQIDRTDDVKMNFKGFIDIVIKTKDVRGNTILYVIDFKTCSWGWDGEKRRDKELQHQLFLYKHFLCKEFGLDPKNVRCAFCLLKRKPIGESDAVEFFPISAGPVSVQRTLDALNSDITDMKVRLETGTIQKNRKSCVNAYGDVCPYYKTDLCTGEKE